MEFVQQDPSAPFPKQIPITLSKESGSGGPGGIEVMKCGFKIGGGIDQDYSKSPQGYSDNVTFFG
jgi:hypothetical protein